MSATIEPEPSEQEREAILASLGRLEGAGPGDWAQAALVEGVEGSELDP